MKDNLLYSNVATEVVEIFNYLEEDILLKIPQKVIEKIYKLKNNNHLFKIDKNKSLEEQNMLKETREVLSILFLKYCCSKEEANEILKQNSENIIDEEQPNLSIYNTDNIFKNKKQIEVLNNTNKLMIVEEKPFYISIIEKIKSFFKNIFGKKEK